MFIGPLLDIPELPPHYLPRAALLARLKAATLDQQASPIAIVPPSPDSGMEGVGKTTLAAALARDADVLSAFPDGVVWLTLGRQPALTVLQARLAQALGIPLWPLGDTQAGKAHLRDALADKACLLILDDVWEIEHLAAFNVLGPRGVMLFTTQDVGQLAMMGAAEVEVAALDDTEALDLLAAWAGQPASTLPTIASHIACEYRDLPLALALIGALARDMHSWDEILQRLHDVDGENRRRSPGVPSPRLLHAIQVAVDTLPSDIRARYLDLAVFPEYAPVPEATLRILWAADGLDAGSVREIMDVLVSRALVQRDTRHRLHLHPMLKRYLQAHVGNWPALHDRLLRAYQAILPARTAADDPRIWRALPPDEPYLWPYLTYHLAEAHRQEQSEWLLQDFDWIRAQLEATDVITLLAAYDVLPGESAHPVRDTLRMAAPVVAEDTSQLAGQLWGRLLAHRSPEMRTLLKQARRQQPSPWLRPLGATLMPPGGPLERVLIGHHSPVEAVATTPDGRWIVSGAADGWLRAWDLEQGGTSRTWRGHLAAIKGIAVWPDGRRAISASADRTLKVWNLERGVETAVLKGHIYEVTGVALLPDGLRAISASADSTLKVWDTSATLPTKREALQTLQGRGGPVWAVAVLPDGGRAISASADGAVRLWDLERASVLHTFTGHESEVYAVTTTPDGRWAISGSADRTVKVWDLERGGLVRTMRGHTAPVHAVAVTADEQWIISAAGDGMLKIWDLTRGDERYTLSDHQDAVYAVVTTPDGRAISGSADQTIRVWDLERGAGLHTLTGHRSAVNAVALLPDGERAVSASKDGTIKLWNLKWTQTMLRVLPGHPREIHALTVIGDGRRILSASRDHTLKVWDLEQGVELCTLSGHRAPVTAVAAFADRKRAISGSADRTLILWDLDSGPLRMLTGHQSAITAVSVLPDDRHALSASKDGALNIWDVEQAECLNLAEHNSPIWAIAVARAKPWVILGTADGNIRVWDVVQRAEVYTLQGHRKAVLTVAVTPDGRYALSGSEDHTIKVWHLERQQALATFTGESAMLACAIAPDGLTILAGEASGRLHFLRLEGIG